MIPKAFLEFIWGRYIFLELGIEDQTSKGSEEGKKHDGIDNRTYRTAATLHGRGVLISTSSSSANSRTTRCNTPPSPPQNPQRYTTLLPAQHGRRDAPSPTKLGPPIRFENPPPILRRHVCTSAAIDMAPSI